MIFNCLLLSNILVHSSPKEDNSNPEFNLYITAQSCMAVLLYKHSHSFPSLTPDLVLNAGLFSINKKCQSLCQLRLK